MVMDLNTVINVHKCTLLKHGLETWDPGDFLGTGEVVQLRPILGSLHVAAPIATGLVPAFAFKMA